MENKVLKKGFFNRDVLCSACGGVIPAREEHWYIDIYSTPITSFHAKEECERKEIEYYLNYFSTCSTITGYEKVLWRELEALLQELDNGLG